MSNKNVKTDNSNKYAKAALRKKFLPHNARVLDLFCGNGEMYKLAYKGNVAYYHGVDKEKIHDDTICTLCDNIDFIKNNDISKYNVFDLDDYGCPWPLFYLILRDAVQDELIFYITDGLVYHQKLVGNVTKFVSATEGIPMGMNIPGINRFYVDIFATMLKDIKKRYGWETEKAVYFTNSKRTVYYWMLKMVKANKI